MTFEEIRDKLRSEPNQKKAIPKVERNHMKKAEMFPNERVAEDHEDGIYFDNDIMDKDYYYRRLAERLGYSRVYNFSGSSLFVIQSTRVCKTMRRRKASCRIKRTDSTSATAC